MGIGVWQIVLILAIVLIIFGAGKLPKVMGDMGKGIKSFKAGINEKEEDAGASRAWTTQRSRERAGAKISTAL